MKYLNLVSKSTFSTLPFNSLSPLDGRYSNLTCIVSPYFSQSALMKYRIKIQSQWLIHLVENNIISQSKNIGIDELKQNLNNLVNNFGDKGAQRVKDIQKVTNHDLKAVQYYIKENIHQDYKEAVHFCCTSEDINNLAYALMLKDFSNHVFLPKIQQILQKLLEKVQSWADHKILTRTHGQPATPSTLGKQYANFAYRIGSQLKNIKKVQLQGKINGAVGSYNSHYFSYPQVNWQSTCQSFIQSKLHLQSNPYTTQIQPHDSLCRYLAQTSHLNTINIGLCRDTWQYISLSYLLQKQKHTQTGSSTMPHKINPIDFQNAQGNLGLANSVAEHFRSKLPISRLQRDLSDSTVLRNQGSLFGYSIIAYQSLLKGLNKVDSNKLKMEQDLNNHFQVVTQAVQTELRKINYPQPYQLLKKLSRGTNFTQQSLNLLVKELEVNLKGNHQESIQKIRKLTPLNYGGKAAQLALSCRQKLKQLK